MFFTILCVLCFFFFFFFFNDTATTEIYTLSLTTLFRSPELLPARAFCGRVGRRAQPGGERRRLQRPHPADVQPRPDRKSTRLNSSHDQISYAVFCLKKKKKTTQSQLPYTDNNIARTYTT